MDKIDRIQQLHRIFSARKTPISRRDIADKLECCEKTIIRGIDFLRDQCQAPLEYCADPKGWRYDPSGGKFELPGLWLTADEILGLAVIMQVVQSMDSGLLSNEMNLIERAVGTLLKSRRVPAELFKEKVCYLPKHRCDTDRKAIQLIAEALMNNRQLTIGYLDYSGKKSQRQVSPLKLVHYQENWYLDAWCHLRNGLRSFMLARLETIELTKSPALRIPDEQQQHHFRSSYGIFAGQAQHLAKLRFCNAAANEAASIQWHHEQTIEWQGRKFVLSIPYNDDRELLRTILNYGDQVEVLEPVELRDKVRAKAKAMAALYDEHGEA